ncbi:MAG: class I SAM-dependent methyltransferase, partial [Gammaproteobacteria bacterium]
QRCIIQNKYQNYLEIGMGSGKNFKTIQVAKKISVDPDASTRPVVVSTSDKFFQNEIAAGTRKWNCVFIDGLHEQDQFVRDVLNALSVLDEKGTILCHDVRPLTEQEQEMPRRQKHWTGDVWKGWVRLRARLQSVSMFVIPVETGIGVIKNGSQKLLELNGSELSFANLTDGWLNVISIDEALKRL